MKMPGLPAFWEVKKSKSLKVKKFVKTPSNQTFTGLINIVTVWFEVSFNNSVHF